MEYSRKTIRFQGSFTLRLSAALLARAQRAAAAREQRLSELCRDAIREHLARLERGGGVADER
jgi:predicted HicB family RNase H-like nuclease